MLTKIGHSRAPTGCQKLGMILFCYLCCHFTVTWFTSLAQFISDRQVVIYRSNSERKLLTTISRQHFVLNYAPAPWVSTSDSSFFFQCLGFHLHSDWICSVLSSWNVGKVPRMFSILWSPGLVMCSVYKFMCSHCEDLFLRRFTQVLWIIAKSQIEQTVWLQIITCHDWLCMCQNKFQHYNILESFTLMSYGHMCGVLTLLVPDVIFKE
jgi:hypothetical protein